MTTLAHQHDGGCTWAGCGPRSDEDEPDSPDWAAPDTLRELREDA